MRKGRQIYAGKYEAALKLWKEGKSVKEIAAELNVSYSAAYHWVKGLRKPEKGNVNEFYDYIRKDGPLPTAKVEERFKKHNELFLMANKRGLRMSRHVLQRKYGPYATWYYVDGQEKLLEKRLEQLQETITNVKDKLRSSILNK